MPVGNPEAICERIRPNLGTRPDRDHSMVSIVEQRQVSDKPGRNEASTKNAPPNRTVGNPAYMPSVAVNIAMHNCSSG